MPNKTVLPILLSVGLVLTGCAGRMMETKKSAEMMQDMPSMISMRTVVAVLTLLIRSIAASGSMSTAQHPSSLCSGERPTIG